MKKHNGFRIMLRLGIAGSALSAFLAGWILLGHSDKPAPLWGASTGDTQAQNETSIEGQPMPLPTLAPLPELESIQNFNLRPIPQQNNLAIQPRLRTRGS
jgi:hypothetical protein